MPSSNDEHHKLAFLVRSNPVEATPSSAHMSSTADQTPIEESEEDATLLPLGTDNIEKGIRS